MTPPLEQKPRISLIIPVKNEAESLDLLISSINSQTYAPDEIVLVDGGSTDGTVSLAGKLTAGDDRFRVVETGDATPGRGRNIGAENAGNKWIAFTDAGIKLENAWLEKLVETLAGNPEAVVIYGNYAPVIDTFFEKCAVFAYVSPQRANGIRGKFIASALLKKEVWQKVGGFPDSRAAEDLMFMDEIERRGFNTAYAPEAMVYWQLRPDFSSTFRKFVLYSKHNVWVKRQWQWHYGIARQYLLLLPFVLLALLHSFWWLSAIVGWLFARTAKRILIHRYEFGWTAIVNPFLFPVIMFLIILIDLATFAGWIQAVIQKKPTTL
jgi:glycosyltransferase involved in cell wall biosynthesis